MNEIDKIIVRMGWQIVQLELALQQAQKRNEALEAKIAELTRPKESK